MSCDSIQCVITENKVSVTTQAVVQGVSQTGSTVSSVFGRTGAITAQTGDYTKAQVGLDQVDNTADADKPVSTATQTALNDKADKVSTPTVDDFASLDANGNLQDSGSKASDFADTVHTHIASQVTDFDTEVSNNTDVSANTSHRGTTTGNPHSVNATDVGLSNVENTALSTWAGSANITTVGTVGTGEWQGTTVAIAHGGTGETTAQDAIDALLPSQSGESGHFLTTDGTNSSWGEAGGNEEFDYYVTAGDWSDLVSALEGGSYATVFIPSGTYTCTDNEDKPITIHSNCKYICGQARDKTILDVNSQSNVVTFFYGHDELLVKNLSAINFASQGVANSCVFHGQYSAPSTGYVYNKATRFINCKVSDYQGSHSYYGYGFYKASIENCIVDGGVLASGAFGCQRVVNCTMIDCYWHHYYSCRNLINNTAQHSSSGSISGNTSYYKCYNMTNNQACWIKEGFINCELSYNNRVDSCTIPYKNCIFNDTYMDSTDNTKVLIRDYSGITTGTTRTHKALDNDGIGMLYDSSITPVNNGDLVVEATSDTTLTFKLKGSDGTVRTGTMTLS